MNFEEKLAKEYLEQQSLGTVVFEPDGNIPPDFSVSAQTAVEVSRLNRSFPVNNLIVPEETIYIDFEKMLKEVLSSFDSQYKGKSYWVIADYIRPFKPETATKKDIKLAIERFLNLKWPRSSYKVKVNKCVRLYISKSPIVDEGRTFRKIGGINYEPGSIAQLYIHNIQDCIVKKSRKIQLLKNKYSQWQLFLVDRLRWNLSTDEIEKIKESITDLGLFDCLIVIDYESKLLLKKKTP